MREDIKITDRVLSNIGDQTRRMGQVSGRWQSSTATLATAWCDTPLRPAPKRSAAAWAKVRNRLLKPSPWPRRRAGGEVLMQASPCASDALRPDNQPPVFFSERIVLSALRVTQLQGYPVCVVSAPAWQVLLQVCAVEGFRLAVYVFQEYPKWVGDVLVQDEAQERAHLLTLAETRRVAVAQLTTAPSAAAVRMRRSRERRHEGKRSIPCDISAAQIDMLAAAGFLDLALWDNAVEVARGVGRLMDGLARRSGPVATAPVPGQDGDIPRAGHTQRRRSPPNCHT
jgi:hypothetical protein